MTEEGIIIEAISQFNKLTGVAIRQVAWGELSKHDKMVMDSRVRLKVGKEVVEFAVEAKNELRQMHLPGLLEQIEKRSEEDWLIISQYIPKPLKEELRRLGVNYLEASGNCFIRHGGLFFYINDQAVTPARLPEEGKLWKATGMKFLFVLLQNPHLINESYRFLARVSKIALGNIGHFLDELKNEGYIKRSKDGSLFLENTDQLARKWVGLFPTVLKAKLKMGTFRFIDPGRFAGWPDLKTEKFYWGGEAAGALLTNYLRPERLTIYTRHPKVELMRDLRLVPDENGNVELLEVFWSEKGLEDAALQNQRTVPPILAYAELATSLDSRNRETAEKIRELYFEHER